MAHKGIVKLATGSETPAIRAWRSVTGMVAADDEVPLALANLALGNPPGAAGIGRKTWTG